MTTPILVEDSLESDIDIPMYKIALSRMLSAKDASELGSLIDPSSLPDKPSRDLFNWLRSEMPKGATPSAVEAILKARAKHCLPLLLEIETEIGTEAMYETAENSYIADRVADEGRRVRIVRSAQEQIAAIEEGKPTAEVLDRADRQRAAIDASSPESSRYVLRDDQEIADAPAPEHLIEGVLPFGATATLIGPPGSLKSFCALDWACHVSVGLEWCGRRTMPGQVVYLCGEGGSGLPKRLDAWRAMNNWKGRIGVQFLNHPLTLNDATDVAGIIREMESKGLAPKLVIIDTLARFMLGDENAVKDMGAFIRATDEIKRRFGCTILIVHHSGKDAARGARGSSALQGATDTEIVTDRPEEEFRLVLSCTKQKDGPNFRPIELDAVPIAGSLALKPSGPSTARLAGKTLTGLLALRDNDTGNGLTHAEWLEVADQVKSTFNRSLKSLKEWGYLRVSLGRYSVSDAGRIALQSTRSTAGTPVVHSTGQVSPLGRGYIVPPEVDETAVLNLGGNGSAP